MEASLASFLSGLSATVFRLAAVAFILVNGCAIAIFAVTRSRRFVNDWTGRLVALDAVLLSAGLGVPLLAGLAKIGVHAVTSLFGGAPATR